jgi:amylosucrase
MGAVVALFGAGKVNTDDTVELDRDQVIAAGRNQLESLLGKDSELADILARYDRYAGDLYDGLVKVYPISAFGEVVKVISSVHGARKPALRQRDLERSYRPDWFQSNDALGYVCYVDLFAGDLAALRGRVDYLKDLGVTYLHLMPLLTPRPGANDGGYAVMDYRSVRSDLGTMAQLSILADELHQAGISLTLDLVLNHVAKEHEWAMKAKAGDARYRDYFFIYPDRTIPDQYEKTLPEIFPTFAPGNFTWNPEVSGWVWTTFNEYQWDVNWANPNLFLEYLDVIGFLSNNGADCIRLDAIAFIWKRLGTDSQNQPEVHAITQALRSAVRIFSPSTIFKAEAIVGPKDLVNYLGQGEHAGKVSDIAYHNSLMVQIWSALASRDGRLLSTALGTFAPVPTNAAWATYLRCHDDIGWAIDDSDTAKLLVVGAEHRKFLADFYAGEHEGSFARGVHFQSNPTTGDRRTAGSAASLAGIQRALELSDEASLQTAIDRLACAYAMVFGFGGLPLLYMGDEVGLLNDTSYLQVPEKADDARWINRPAMNWQMVELAKNDATSVAGRVNISIRNLIKARKSLASLHAAVESEVFTLAENPAILVFRRRHAAGELVEIYNLSESSYSIDMTGLITGDLTEHISGKTFHIGNRANIPAYATWWLTRQ